MPLKIATWNINSVRLRAPLLQKLAAEYGPDVICLQETKTPDEHFPQDVLSGYGYAHLHFHGMGGYNGVAIFSKIPIENPQIYHRAGRQDCRHIAATIGGLHIHNLYIPAGGDEPDATINEKFAHKLAFVDEMAAWFKKTHKPADKVVAVGDFNIAPQEHDVWSHKQLLSVVSHTPIEVEKLERMQQSLNWIDTARHFVKAQKKCYTWWSYRNRDWRKSNRGRRLDHIWVTPPLKSVLQAHEILVDARDWPQPSDHVPIMTVLN